MRFDQAQVDRRLAVVRRRLEGMGYVRLDAGRLPGYANVEAWTVRGTVVYLAWNPDSSWTVVAPVCTDGTTEDLFEALEHFAACA